MKTPEQKALRAANKAAERASRERRRAETRLAEEERARFMHGLSTLLNTRLGCVVDIDEGNRQTGKLRIAIREHSLTFDQLAMLAELFGTRNINVGSETRDEGFCDTCRVSHNMTTVFLADVTVWPVTVEPAEAPDPEEASEESDPNQVEST